MTLILRAQQTHDFDAKKIAREIRPLIGLTTRQVEANAKYRRKIFDQYIKNGASVKVANQRADKAALKYASKQHRYRAETIVNTELAFAYNQGAHIGVLQAINAGLMGRCAMVWTTAGTNRVCPRCLALKGSVVGYTNESGVTLPPIHPRCRCTIEYREVEPPKLTAPQRNVNVGGENKPLTMPAANLHTNGTVSTALTFAENFSPAKTIEEANEFAMKTLGILQAEYKGCAVEVANEWNFALLETLTKFPELRKYFGFVGEAHARNTAVEETLFEYYVQDLLIRYPNAERNVIESSAKYYVSINMKKLEFSKEHAALSWSPTTPLLKRFRGVVVNLEYAKDYNLFKELATVAVRMKYRPVGCTTIRSCLDHEVGHQLNDLLGLSSMSEVKELFDSRVTIKNGVEDFSRITDELSRYAWENNNPDRYSEFIAEAWAEYCNNNTPREIARKIGKIVEREYAKRFPRGE